MRRVAVVFLLVLGCGLTAAALISLWTRATILDTDRYVETMAPIAASPAVQKAVVDKLDTQVTDAIDFDALAREVLPDRADVLWDSANRKAHATVVALLATGKSGGVALEDNTVYLDLSAVVDRIKERLNARGYDRIAGAIPDSVDGQIPLLTSDSFGSARKAINLLKGLTIVLPILALLCFAEHRAATSWGIVLLGGLVLVAWDNPTAAVVLVDAALIAVALWIVTVLARGARQPAS
jgi:hypothetical protein